MCVVVNKICNCFLDVVGEVIILVDDIVDKLLSDDNVILYLMNSKSEFEDIYFYFLNVLVIVMMIGKVRGLFVERIKELVFVVLFYDIGKVRVLMVIVCKKILLMELEENYLWLYIKYGIELVDNIEMFFESVKCVIE